MYGQLGDILFQGIYSPDEEERTDSVSLPQLSRINRRPLQQFTGIDLAVMKLTVTLHNSFIDVEAAITKFRRYRNSATHLRYITGSGNVKGTFVIQKTVEKTKQTDRNGNYVHATLEHTLIELSGSTPRLDSINTALANTRNNPPVYPVPVRRPAPTIETSAALDVIGSQSQVQSSLEVYSTAPVEPEKAEAKMLDVAEVITDAQDKLSNAVQKVQTAATISQQAQAYTANMYQAITDIGTAATAIPNTDFTNPFTALTALASNMSQMSSSMSVMFNTSQPLAAFTGSRQ